MRKVILFADIYNSFPELENFYKQEWESLESIQFLMNTIQSLNYEVELIEPKKNIEDFLKNISSYKKENTIFFNLVEGFNSRNRESYIPSLAEFLGFPYTGSDAYSTSISLDKFLTKKIIQDKFIPTKKTLKINKSDYKEKKYFYPCFIKPNGEGSSLGIKEKNIIYKEDDLNYICEILFKQFDELIIEEYLKGDDLTVAVLGNFPNYKSTRVARIKYDSIVFDENIKSKSEMPEKLYFDLDSELEKKIQNDSMNICKELKISGYSRIDWKLDEKNNPYFLEINLTPGLSKFYSSLPICYIESFGNYTSLIQEILLYSIESYKSDYRFQYGKFRKK